MFGLKEKARHRLFHKLSGLTTAPAPRLGGYSGLAARLHLAHDNRFLSKALGEERLRALFPQIKSYTVFSTRYLAQVVLRGRLFDALASSGLRRGDSQALPLVVASEFYRAANTASCWFANPEQNAKKFQNQPFPFVALPEVDLAKVPHSAIEAERLFEIVDSLRPEVSFRFAPALNVCVDDLKAHPVHPGRPLVPVELPSHKTAEVK